MAMQKAQIVFRGRSVIDHMGRSCRVDRDWPDENLDPCCSRGSVQAKNDSPGCRKLARQNCFAGGNHQSQAAQWGAIP